MMPPFEVLPEEQIVAILAYVDRGTEVAKLKPFAIARTGERRAFPRTPKFNRVSQKGRNLSEGNEGGNLTG